MEKDKSIVGKVDIDKLVRTVRTEDQLMRKAAAGKNNQVKPEPRLGIFWLVDGNLLIDSIALKECEDDRYFRNYPGSHIDVWERWMRTGKAPAESEYEEFARGRVIFDTKTKTFTLLADRCILKRKDLVAEIKKQLCLPKQTSLGTDPHYRCFQCLHRNRNT